MSRRGRFSGDHETAETCRTVVVGVPYTSNCIYRVANTSAGAAANTHGLQEHSGKRATRPGRAHLHTTHRLALFLRPTDGCARRGCALNLLLWGNTFHFGALWRAFLAKVWRSAVRRRSVLRGRASKIVPRRRLRSDTGFDVVQLQRPLPSRTFLSRGDGGAYSLPCRYIRRYEATRLQESHVHMRTSCCVPGAFFVPSCGLPSVGRNTRLSPVGGLYMLCMYPIMRVCVNRLPFSPFTLLN